MGKVKDIAVILADLGFGYPVAPDWWEMSEEDWLSYCRDMEEMRAEYDLLMAEDEEEVLPF